MWGSIVALNGTQALFRLFHLISQHNARLDNFAFYFRIAKTCISQLARYVAALLCLYAILQAHLLFPFATK